VSVQMTLSDLEMRDARIEFFRLISNYAGIVWPRATKFGTVTRGR